MLASKCFLCPELKLAFIRVNDKTVKVLCQICSFKNTQHWIQNSFYFWNWILYSVAGYSHSSSFSLVYQLEEGRSYSNICSCKKQIYTFICSSITFYANVAVFNANLSVSISLAYCIYMLYFFPLYHQYLWIFVTCLVSFVCLVLKLNK